MNYTRNELIDLCEKSIVEVSKRSNRDTPHAQEKVGTLWALLKGGCSFKILTEGNLASDSRTIWLEVYYPQFRHFDWDGFDLNDVSTLGKETFYLPTPSRLEECSGKDWY